ncbi:MAG: aldose 1-epimerase family protein [Clostridia bacterium]|nr:aldose 1-epimerase family protein [Clostridia bacterium]
MLYTLKNDYLTIQACDLGAELHSVLSSDGCEYLWQGDPAHWTGRAPWMFPFCGRQFEGKYAYNGKLYEITNHGFAKLMPFTMTSQTEDSMTFTLLSSDETRKIYPFDFSFSVTYRLIGNRIAIRLTVENTGKELLPFSVGAHPGFRAPVNGQGAFEDCYLEFGEYCCPDKLIFTENLLPNGKRCAYPLRNGRIIDLNRPMFYNDATFLARTARTVTLRSAADRHSVTVKYTDFPYVGVWTKPHDDHADYVCIEPWSGLPAVDGTHRRLETESDTYRLPPDGIKTFDLEYMFE